MRKSSFIKESTAILLTILFCALGFLAIWLAKHRLELKEEAVYIAFLVLPILIYLIIAGKVLEFKAFGAEAKFADVANQPVEQLSETIEPSVDDTQVVAKEGIKELKKRIPFLDISKPIILTLVLGKRDYYDHHALSQYIEVLSQYRTFKGVVILDSDHKFQVYFPSDAIIGILKSVDGNEIIQDINDGRIDKIRRYPGGVVHTLTKHSTNLEALQEMTTRNLDELVVMNEDGKPTGVVERQQLIGKLLMAMAK
jgi:CBS domain-containing protein